MPRPRKNLYPHIVKGAAEPPFELLTDQAIPIDEDRTFLVTKGSAGAFSIAAPGQGNVGRSLTFLTGTDFAHVFTFTGSSLRDGTTGASITWTSAAFAGSAITVRAVSATLWNVESMNLGAVA